MVFHQTKAKHKLYGGSAGGGKTDGLLGELLLNCMRYPGIKQLFIRRTFSEITEILEERLKKLVYSDNGIGYNRSRSSNTLRFAGSEIILGYWLGNKTADKYFSMEYDVIAVDEITRTIYDYKDFEKLCSRNRSSKKDLKALGFEPYVMCATNPGGHGHGYIKQLFIDGDIPDGYLPEHFKFVPAKLDDNPHLLENDPFYKIRLNALSDNDLKRALLDGDRDIFEGKFWGEFYKSRHVCDYFQYVGGVKRSVLSLDYGYTAPSAVYKISLDNDKKTYISNEIYRTKLDYYELGRLIRSTFGGDPTIECIVADPAIFSNTGNIESGAMIISRESGMKVIPGNNSRIPGRSKLRELFRENNIHIHSTCTAAISEFTDAVHDGKKDGDLDSAKDDHAMDSIRYGTVHLHGLGATVDDIQKINKNMIKKGENILNTNF